VQDGVMDLPEGAGLGIELAEDVVQRYRTDGRG
jgi:L-alanine-DL-glutamate epimerase-like enolase superfamily enzyme